MSVKSSSTFSCETKGPRGVWSDGWESGRHSLSSLSVGRWIVPRRVDVYDVVLYEHLHGVLSSSDLCHLLIPWIFSWTTSWIVSVIQRRSQQLRYRWCSPSLFDEEEDGCLVWFLVSCLSIDQRRLFPDQCRASSCSVSSLSTIEVHIIILCGCRQLTTTSSG